MICHWNTKTVSLLYDWLLEKIFFIVLWFVVGKEKFLLRYSSFFERIKPLLALYALSSNRKIVSLLYWLLLKRKNCFVAV